MKEETSDKRIAVLEKRKNLINEVDSLVEKYTDEIIRLSKGDTFQELLESMIPFAGYELGSCLDDRVRELIRNKALKRRL